MDHGNITNTDRFDRRSRARMRRPSYSVFIENHGDVTDKVKTVTWGRQLKPELDEPLSGSGQITLLDLEGDLIRDGRCTIRADDKVKIWAGFEGENIPRFTGIVYDPKLDTRAHQVELGIGDYGHKLRKLQTSGDYSDYDNPKELIDELFGRLSAGSVEYENEAGDPTTYTFGNTTLERRDYWSIIHGATLSMDYLYWLDENGNLQCKRRDSFTDVDFSFDDSNIAAIEHVEMAELVNKRVLGDDTDPGWSGFSLGDGVRFGQSTYTYHHRVSQALFGVHSSYEDDELIDGWDNVYRVVKQNIHYFAWPRQVYDMTVPALPQLQIQDRFPVDSADTGIKGRFTIIGQKEHISPGNFHDTFRLLSEPERS